MKSLLFVSLAIAALAVKADSNDNAKPGEDSAAGKAAGAAAAVNACLSKVTKCTSLIAGVESAKEGKKCGEVQKVADCIKEQNKDDACKASFDGISGQVKAKSSELNCSSGSSGLQVTIFTFIATAMAILLR